MLHAEKSFDSALILWILLCSGSGDQTSRLSPSLDQLAKVYHQLHLLCGAGTAASSVLVEAFRDSRLLAVPADDPDDLNTKHVFLDTGYGLKFVDVGECVWEAGDVVRECLGGACQTLRDKYPTSLQPFFKSVGVAMHPTLEMCVQAMQAAAREDDAARAVMLLAYAGARHAASLGKNASWAGGDDTWREGDPWPPGVGTDTAQNMRALGILLV